MNKRKFLQSGTAIGLSCWLNRPGHAADPWGADQGYPTGWGPPGQPPKWEAYPEYRAGNYSGGLEKMFRHHRVRAGDQVSPLEPAPRAIAYRWGLTRRSPEDYLARWPISSLLIARDGLIHYEAYRMGRSADMRMTSWSMAKSVTSLLLGVALDRGLVRSVDDLPQAYVPSLQGSLHGSIPIRHLLNMSSGADVLHQRDPPRIDVPAILGDLRARTVGTDLEQVVRHWNARLEEPGTRFNYNELCPLTLGMVLRSVSGMSLAEFAQSQLWQPLGAEADATWLTDAKGKEYNCVGFAARTRDWARLGQLVAQNGRMGEQQVVSAGWLQDCASWGALDQQVRWGRAGPDTGYKNFFWHPRQDGNWLVMNGHHGQRVVVDRTSRTVMVQTALGPEGPWQKEFYALFEAATQA